MFKGGITILFFLEDDTRDMGSKTEFFSEHPFLRIKGQGHSFFQIQLLTLRTIFPTSQLRVGEGEEGRERADISG